MNCFDRRVAITDEPTRVVHDRSPNISLVKATMALLLATAIADIIVRMLCQVPMSSAPLGSGLRDTLSNESAQHVGNVSCTIGNCVASYSSLVGQGVSTGTSL